VSIKAKFKVKGSLFRSDDLFWLLSYVSITVSLNERDIYY